LDEQHLAHELENLTKPGHHTAADGSQARRLFDPKVKLRPNRRLVPSAGDGPPGPYVDPGQPAVDFRESRRRKPWLEYESLRGETYPVGDGRGAASSSSSSSSSARSPLAADKASKGPRFQDLTHDEAQRLQEMYMRKRMLDRKIMWMKMQDLPNPQKEAKMTLRREEREKEESKLAVEGSGGEMYPPPFLDQHPQSRRLTKMEEKARHEELESRFRNRIRTQKLENARIVKGAAPRVGDVITDPIERHVSRRLVRQRVKIHAGLEDILTRNTAQILYEFLKGVSISVVKVRAKTPRATQQIYYSISSDHDPAWVQRQLDVLAPKLRSQLAVKVNMGQTPNIRFVPYVQAEEVRREHLWHFAKQIQDSTPLGGGFGSDVGGGFHPAGTPRSQLPEAASGRGGLR